jgi:hypothetical protein
MAIIAKKSSSDFVLCPAGAHVAVCCDVVDLGIVKTNWQGKEKEQHKIRVVWQIAEKTQDGKPYIAQRRYTLSLDDRAALRAALESWRGRAFSADELNGFDVEKLVGVGCMLSVVHEQRDGKTYDNVNGVMRLPKGVTPPVIEGYVRVKDRPKDGADGPSDDEVPAGGGISDDDIPF